MPEYSGFSAFAARMDEPWTDAELVAVVAGEELLHEPGGAWSDSNTHCVLLGMVAAEATGMPWQSLLNERFFAPLSLAETAVPVGSWGDIVPC